MGKGVFWVSLSLIVLSTTIMGCPQAPELTIIEKSTENPLLECTRDADCEDEESCAYGRCAILPDCRLHSDCNPGDRCVDAVCETVEGELPECGPDDPCPIAFEFCNDHGHCQVCDVDNEGEGNLLEEICGDANHPTPGCSTASDCDAGQTCVEFECVDALTCEDEEASCPDNHTCGPLFDGEGSVCIPDLVECVLDEGEADKAEGGSCQDGRLCWAPEPIDASTMGTCVARCNTAPDAKAPCRLGTTCVDDLCVPE